MWRQLYRNTRYRSANSPPAVSTTTPAADANLEATFSQELLLSRADATQSQNGNNISATVTFDGTTATLNPNDDLLASTRYDVSLKKGIVDTDGEALTT